jgi:addiction module HigA family antidote
LLPLGITQQQLADQIGYEVKAINRLVNGRTRVTADMALALERALGSSARFWLNLQTELDLFDARQRATQAALSAP